MQIAANSQGLPYAIFPITPFNECYYHPTLRMRKLRLSEAMRPARDRPGVQVCLDQSWSSQLPGSERSGGAGPGRVETRGRVRAQ